MHFFCGDWKIQYMTTKRFLEDEGNILLHFQTFIEIDLLLKKYNIYPEYNIAFQMLFKASLKG